jgi:hypothetical protein
MEKQLDEAQVKEWLSYAVSLYQDDKNDYEVKEALKARGASEPWVSLIQTRALDAYESSEKKGGSSAMLIGIGMILLGVVLTFVSANGSGMRIFYGLMIVGAINFFRGAAQRWS